MSLLCCWSIDAVILATGALNILLSLSCSVSLQTSMSKWSGCEGIHWIRKLNGYFPPMWILNTCIKLEISNTSYWWDIIFTYSSTCSDNNILQMTNILGLCTSNWEQWCSQTKCDGRAQHKNFRLAMQILSHARFNIIIHIILIQRKSAL